MISATIICDLYKIGLRGNVFIWRLDDWYLSNNVTASEVRLHYKLEQEKIKEAEQKEKLRQQRKQEKEAETKV